MDTCDHILAKYGVMANFSIAKKVTKERIKRMSDRLNTEDEMSAEFQEALKQEILKETQVAIFNNTIPGLITNAKVNKSSIKPKIINDKDKRKVTLLSAIIIQTILEKKLTKDETCLLIIQMVNALGLKDSDFKDFTQRYYIQTDDEDEDEDDYYDGDEEDD